MTTVKMREAPYAALITGASSGIGLELARVLAANGHPLMIVARDEARLKTAAVQLRSDYGVSVTWYARDLAEPHGADHLWADVVKAEIAVDVLVNNAGVGLYGEFHDQSLDSLWRMQMVNVLAVRGGSRVSR